MKFVSVLKILLFLSIYNTFDSFTLMRANFHALSIPSHSIWISIQLLPLPLPLWICNVQFCPETIENIWCFCCLHFSPFHTRIFLFLNEMPLFVINFHYNHIISAQFISCFKTICLPWIWPTTWLLTVPYFILHLLHVSNKNLFIVRVSRCC